MRTKVSSSSGQTLVLVALLMVVLLGLLALAIDVGLIYQVRRGMQNAADAGALAAARAWCFGGEGGTYGTVEQAIAAGENYAITRNAADAATVTPSEDNFVWTVTATREADLFFANIFGLSTTPVGATAAAKCGKATGACGLWPIGFSVEQWEALYNNGAGCEEPIAIWSDKSAYCAEPDPTGNRPCCDPWDPTDPDCQPIDCDKYDCDISNPPDGVDDVFTDRGRAWIDYTGYEDPDNPGEDCPVVGCGADELSDCVRASPNVLLEPPACLSADLGVRAAIKLAVADRVGDVVGVPLFDPTPDICVGPDTCREHSYLVVDFGCIKVLGMKFIQLKPTEPGKPWNGWVIMAEMYCGGCNTNCGGTSGDSPNPGDGDIRGVSLIR